MDAVNKSHCLVLRWVYHPVHSLILERSVERLKPKNERVHRMVYPTKDKAINDIASWIELKYNRTRLHSALGYRTPDEVESDFLDLTKAA